MEHGAVEGVAWTGPSRPHDHPAYPAAPRFR